MDCEGCREALSAGLDGEDAPGERALVLSHLVGCPACRACEEQLHHLHRRLRLRPAEPVPDLTAAVLGSLPAVVPRRRRGGDVGRPVVAAAAAVVAVLVGVGAVVGASVGRGDGGGDEVALVEATGAYATATAAGGLSSVHLTLRNHGDDEDALVQVDAEVAELVELHATVITGGGVAVMRTVDEFPLAAGSDGTVRAGRSHVMLVDVVRPLRPGDSLVLVLHFGHAPAVHLEAEVVAEGTALARAGAAVRRD